MVGWTYIHLNLLHENNTPESNLHTHENVDIYVLKSFFNQLNYVYPPDCHDSRLSQPLSSERLGRKALIVRRGKLLT